MIPATLAACGFALWAAVDRRAREANRSWAPSPAWGLMIVALGGGWLLGAGSALAVLFWTFVVGGVSAGMMSVGVGFWWWTAPVGHPEPPTALMGMGALLILIETALALLFFATRM